jgi:hypothetical protein
MKDDRWNKMVEGWKNGMLEWWNDDRRLLAIGHLLTAKSQKLTARLQDCMTARL